RGLLTTPPGRLGMSQTAPLPGSRRPRTAGRASWVAKGGIESGGTTLSSQRNAPGGRHEGLIAICLLLLLGLVAVAMAGVVPEGGRVPVRVGPLTDVQRPDGLPPGSIHSASVLRFELPPANPEARWVLRLEREAVDAVWLEAGDWHSPGQGVFQPGPGAGGLAGRPTRHLA